MVAQAKRHSPALALALGLACTLVACLPVPEPYSGEEGGCAYDLQCRGDRVCVNGTCQDPSAQPQGPDLDNTTPSDPAPADPTPRDPTPSDPTPRDPAPSDPTPQAGGQIPCAQQQILVTKCGQCHGATPSFGAPIPLVTLEDLRAYGAGVVERIGDLQRPMPQPPLPPLSAQERELLTQWIRQGAPAGEACDGPIEGGDPGEVMPDPTPALDCDYDLELTAHGNSAPNDTSPFSVPHQTDLYMCYTFDVPWNTPVHGLAFTPIIDDERVLHHYLLYAVDSGGNANGDVRACNGQHPGAALIAGWAPGGNPSVMPEGVGLEMPRPGGRFILEIHYHNQAGHRDALDRSGVRVCATNTLRPNTAATHWLGTEGILFAGGGTHQSRGTCRPRANAPINVISASPHMHKRGRRMASIIHRQGGGQDVLIDQPFDFENQLIYPTPTVINPGDRIETTCTFDNSVGGVARFGPRTEDEMCYNFVVAWPVGGMDTGGSIIGVNHACLR